MNIERQILFDDYSIMHAFLRQWYVNVFLLEDFEQSKL